eukprot:gnl/TRDRNA2_/TRDRNA2_163935_c0_seq17.p1 gnl/TRDRNA2_/TRDRNA2_163935_c0~~gnl/TRDRNA2_/TRDRNA2_163935_c0_seq17.p1  ORF type:complete len:476 (+),score=60.45 gnl/TRDRNA2_/TRDRNA2_163935_c0_seq17:110-1537(+)
MPTLGTLRRTTAKKRIIPWAIGMSAGSIPESCHALAESLLVGRHHAVPPRVRCSVTLLVALGCAVGSLMLCLLGAAKRQLVIHQLLTRSVTYANTAQRRLVDGMRPRALSCHACRWCHRCRPAASIATARRLTVKGASMEWHKICQCGRFAHSNLQHPVWHRQWWQIYAGWQTPRLAGVRAATDRAEGAAGNLPKIGMVQMCARNDKAVNFDVCQRYVDEAVALGCQLVSLPECFSFIGAKAGEAQAAAEPLTGPTMQRYCDLAKARGVWLSLGGFQEKPSEDPTGEGKILNAHVIINASGEIVSTYRKIHLFDVPFTGFMESEQSIPGKDVVTCDSPVGKLGVTICYDLRFPELFQNLRFTHGCDVMLIPSAFMMKTGEAHWETLLRARAIETQSYVIAAAQAGQHNEDGNKRTSWGHSLAVNPWGKVVAEMDGLECGVRVVEIDRELIAKTRREMPHDIQRRYDIYGPGANAK